ncbi:hypothetical protein [Streptomyces sp. NPDC029004]|uniref:hypothetical protein n=1 Tax=Streptomyces sp. NPDC029004 TaxID=3154490 RepID=UPI0033F36C85
MAAVFVPFFLIFTLVGASATSCAATEEPTQGVTLGEAAAEGAMLAGTAAIITAVFRGTADVLRAIAELKNARQTPTEEPPVQEPDQQ